MPPHTVWECMLAESCKLVTLSADDRRFESTTWSEATIELADRLEIDMYRTYGITGDMLHSFGMILSSLLAISFAVIPLIRMSAAIPRMWYEYLAPPTALFLVGVRYPLLMYTGLPTWFLRMSRIDTR